jgi:EmrB/QacA subfamily drug resistance transporter
VTAQDTAVQSSQGGLDPRRWWILALCGLGQLMVVLDMTVVNIALPKAQVDLGFSNDDRQWIVTAYSLAFGGLLLLGGRLADRFGRKRMFIIGMTGFALASAFGGLATSFAMLASARALQGAFGALLAPSTLSLLTTTFSEPGERGKAFGIYGAIAGSGSAIGLLLGGALTEYLSWRWCLYINDFFAVIGIAGAAVLLAKSTTSREVHIDGPGTVLAVGGLVSLVYGFSEAATDGWTSAVTIGLLVAAVVLLTIFVIVEQRVAHPLLPLQVVLDRTRAGSYLAIGLVCIGMFGVFLFLTYFLQETMRFSPIVTGAAFLPLVAAMMLSSISTTTKLLPRFGPRTIVPVGALLGAVAMFLLTRLTVTSSYGPDVVPALIIMGLGLGGVFGAAMNMATAGARAEDAGVASAMVTTGQQIGGAVGTALLNTIATSAGTSYIAAHIAAASASPAAKQLVEAKAAVHSYDVAFWVAAGVLLATAVICRLVFKPGRPAALLNTEPALAGV